MRVMMILVCTVKAQSRDVMMIINSEACSVTVLGGERKVTKKAKQATDNFFFQAARWKNENECSLAVKSHRKLGKMAEKNKYRYLCEGPWEGGEGQGSEMRGGGE